METAYEQYAFAISEYNTAQFDLYRALGQPAQWVTSLKWQPGPPPTLPGWPPAAPAGLTDAPAPSPFPPLRPGRWTGPVRSYSGTFTGSGVRRADRRASPIRTADPPRPTTRRHPSPYREG